MGQITFHHRTRNLAVVGLQAEGDGVQEDHQTDQDLEPVRLRKRLPGAVGEESESLVLSFERLRPGFGPLRTKLILNLISPLKGSSF